MAEKRILLVEDDEEISQLLDQKLSREGFEIVRLVKGAEALEKTKEFLPHLILLDIILPDMDGGDVARALQENLLTKDIPVIFLSGIIDKGEGGPISQIKVGEREYPAIGKPFTPEELLEMIKKTIL